MQRHHSSHPTLAALARVVCPPDLGPRGATREVVDHALRALGSFPTPLRLGLLAGLAGFEVSAALWPSARGRTFSRLDEAGARAHFARWWASAIPPARLLAKAAKALLVVAYYEQEASQHAMAYDPERWIAEATKRRLAQFGDDIVRHEAAVLAADPLPAIGPVLCRPTS